jgi:hypothetical protein
MIIRNFRNMSFDNNENDLESIGILEHKRNIIIFVNPDEYKYNTIRTGRAVIINECSFLSNSLANVIHPAINNTNIVRISVYFCDVEFAESRNPKTATFLIRCGYSKDIENIFATSDPLSNIHVPAYYSLEMNDLVMTPDIDRDSAKRVIDNINGGTNTTVVYPQYYTEGHMHLKEGEYYPMYAYDIACNVMGQELYDSSTRVVFLDINLWDSMRTEIMQKFQNELITDSPIAQIRRTFDFSDEITSSFENFIGEDSVFIYDSDGKGLGIPGYTIKNGTVPLKDYFHMDFIKKNVNFALESFIFRCRDIEKDYGHVRIICAPNFVGSKIKARFKDYIPGNEPIQNLNDKTTASIDGGFKTENEVNDYIYQYGKADGISSDINRWDHPTE